MITDVHNAISPSSYGHKDQPAAIKFHIMAPSHVCTVVFIFTVSKQKCNILNLCLKGIGFAKNPIFSQRLNQYRRCIRSQIQLNQKGGVHQGRRTSYNWIISIEWMKRSGEFIRCSERALCWQN